MFDQQYKAGFETVLDLSKDLGGYNSQVSELNAQLKNLTKQLEAKGYTSFLHILFLFFFKFL